MKLHVTRSGQGTPLVILHGLFGTLENWGSQTRTFADQFSVYAVDLRNHGRSPHASECDYASMAADVIELLDDEGLTQVDLLGHSMGGKVAMQLALNHPQRVRRLVVVDIAPVSYPPQHDAVFQGLFSIDLALLSSRGEADRQLATRVSEPGVRQFLLKNLYRHAGQFAWRMNLEALHRNYQQISEPPQGPAPFGGPTLFIKGGNSDYIQPAHRDAILSRFPATQLKVIEGAGHWPHAEKPSLFNRLVTRFLGEESGD